MYYTQLKKIQTQNSNNLEDIYTLHKAIMSGFKDYKNPGRILYREEKTPNNGSIILMQSPVLPNPVHFTEELKMQATKELDISTLFKEKDKFRFRLVAAPSRKPVQEKRRRALKNQKEQIEWLLHKGQKHGFKLLQTQEDDWSAIDMAPTYNITIKPLETKNGKKENHKITIPCIQYDGEIEVTDSQLFLQVVQNGIGSAKSFGMGLLSLKRN